MAAGISSPSMVTPSRSFQSFPRTQDVLNSSPPSIRTPPLNRSSLSPSDSYNQPSGSSSSPSTSGSSSTPPSASCSTSGNRSSNSKQHYQRPSTLHGLKHKLHSSSCSKSLHAASPSCPANVPSRRKSVGHIPLSPLARTPSPSPLPASPTRSPSPLAFPVGHQPGSSNTTQSYSPSAGSTPTTAVSGQTKKGFVRPKGSEPGSPLLRRALSPDRLHPRSAESKCALISPLCCASSGSPPVVKAASRGNSSTVWRPTPAADPAKENERDDCTVSSSSEGVSGVSTTSVGTNTDSRDRDRDRERASDNSNRLSLTLSGPGEFLPRIAEEKDSPTNSSEAKAASK